MAVLAVLAVVTRWSSWVRREPLLTFAVVAGAAFWLLAPHVPWGRPTIRIDSRVVDDVVERETNRKGRKLSVEERDRAIEAYIGEEILLREAFRHRWHLESGPVRQRLLVAMRAMLDVEVPPASDAQLRAYYQANADRYRTPETVTLSHVFFEDEPPPNVLRSLEDGANFRAMGNQSWLGDRVVRQSEHQLHGSLGASFAEAVFALDSGTWAGPLTSERGYHFVRVDARHPSELPDFGTMKRFIAVDWQTARRAEIRERNMTRIRERYTVVEP